MSAEDDPERLPTGVRPSGRCPRCGHIAMFTQLQANTIADEIVHVFRCQQCLRGLLVVERVRDDLSPPDEMLHSWPPRGIADIDVSVPAAVADIFKEGCRALRANAPRAAVFMFRGLVADVVRDKGSRKAAGRTSLAEQLAAVAAEGGVPSSLAEWAAEIPLLADAARQSDTRSDVGAEEAAELADFARRLIDVVYEVPARIERSRKHQRQLSG